MNIVKKLILLSIIIYSCNVSIGQTIYSTSINDIDGNNLNLSNFSGTKILICTVPINSDDSVIISQLDSLKKFSGNKIKIIGILSMEDGYVDSNKTRVKNIYQSRGINITLTGGMYTKKSSGSNQSSLCSWLTNKSINGRFNADFNGIGQKFFLDSNGKLFAILPPEVPFISGMVVNNVNKRI